MNFDPNQIQKNKLFSQTMGQPPKRLTALDAPDDDEDNGGNLTA